MPLAERHGIIKIDIPDIKTFLALAVSMTGQREAQRNNKQLILVVDSPLPMRGFNFVVEYMALSLGEARKLNSIS